MPIAMLLSAAIAVSWGQPLSEAELADANVGVAMPTTVFATIAPSPWPTFGSAPLVGEQVDAWWAEDGLALIAEAVRPTPSLPVGLDITVLAAGRLDLRVTLTRSTGDR